MSTVSTRHPARTRRRRNYWARLALRGGRWAGPPLVAATAGFCVMVVELVASRLVAPYIGHSLGTWAAVIGVILAGMGVGSYCGGRLADRWPPCRLLSTTFLLAATAVAGLLILTPLVGQATAGWTSTPWLRVGRLGLVTLLPFFAPGLLLGLAGPAVVRWAVAAPTVTARSCVGARVGIVYAASAVGSILGTLLTGFVLMAHLTLPAIIGVTALVLLLIAMALLLAARDETARGHVAPPPFEPPGAPNVLSSVGAAAGRWPLALPGALAFGSGCLFMALELAAARLVTAQLGHSLYSWTSVLGVFLVGMSVGNLLGGRLADRIAPRSLLAVEMLAAAVLCLAILPRHVPLIDPRGAWLPDEAPWSLRLLWGVAAVFLPPAIALATINPTATRWALQRAPGAAGGAVGALFFWNIAGCIVGTLATAFVAIPWWHGHRVVALTAGGLLLPALAFALLGQPRWLKFAVAAVAAPAAALVGLACLPAHHLAAVVLTLWPLAASDLSRQQLLDAVQLEAVDIEHPEVFAAAERISFVATLVGREGELMLADGPIWYDESDYFQIRVRQRTQRAGMLRDAARDEGDRATWQPSRRLRELMLDDAPQGYVDLADPSYLHRNVDQFQAQVAGWALSRAARPQSPRRALFLGGGIYALPRYLRREVPDLQCHLVEIDPQVTRAGIAAMGMNQAAGIRLVLMAGDGPERTALERQLHVAGAVLVDPSEAADAIPAVELIVDAGAPATSDAAQALAARITPHPPVVGWAEFASRLTSLADPAVTVHHVDARQFVLRHANDEPFNVIVNDTLAGLGPPAHLATVEFHHELARLLASDGVYVVPVVDVLASSRFLGAMHNTLSAVFPHVQLHSPTSWEFDQPATWVFLASRQPLHQFASSDETTPGAATLVPNDVLRQVELGGLPIVGRANYVGNGVLTRYALPTDRYSAGLVQVMEAGERWLLVAPPSVEFQGRRIRLGRAPADGAAISITLFGDRPIVLTDYFAPVENLLAPVAARRSERAANTTRRQR